MQFSDMSRYRFNAASPAEQFVFGAQRPGYPVEDSVPDAEVEEWARCMQEASIRRVCCLLDEQLSCYESDLLGAYKRLFGEQSVCWAPIEDFTLADETLLTQTILPFLADSVKVDEPVVVHCSGGIGRTGHVLAAWLVYGRGMTSEQAIQAVIEMGRNPYEAEGSGAEGRAKLKRLLDAARAAAE